LSKSEEKSFLEKIFSEECVDTYIRYLGALKVVEADYGLFDKLARPRDIEDFALAVYNSIRVQERVLRRLQDGLQRGDYEVIGDVRDVNKAFRIGKECVSKIIELAKNNPRFVGSIVASLALAYEGVKSKR
jgi:hypothetical protein